MPCCSASRRRTTASTTAPRPAVIGSRADALGRFTAAYAQLAKLPPPRLGAVVPSAGARVAGLETRVPVS